MTAITSLVLTLSASSAHLPTLADADGALSGAIRGGIIGGVIGGLVGAFAYLFRKKKP